MIDIPTLAPYRLLIAVLPIPLWAVGAQARHPQAVVVVLLWVKVLPDVL